MEGLLIRRLGPGEGGALLAAAPLFDRPPDPAGIQALLADGRSVLLLATRDGAAVGFVRAYELPQIKSPGPMMLLYEVEVALGSRRRGVGAALIDTIKSICRARGVEKMFVITSDANIAAMARYRSSEAERPASDDVVWVWRFR